MEKNAPKFNLNKKLLAIAGGAVAVIGLAGLITLLCVKPKKEIRA